MYVNLTQPRTFPKVTASFSVGQLNTTTYISEMAAACNVGQLKATTYISEMAAG